jgi:hypothetical protein
MHPQPGWAEESEEIMESFYSKKKRDMLVEQGALTAEEDGFMQGYEDEDHYDELEDDDEYVKFEPVEKIY